MISRPFLMLFSLVLVLSGCITPPQKPIDMDKNAMSPGSGKIGVALADLPKIDTHIYGAGCLLCYGIAASAMEPLTNHAQTLPYESIPDLPSGIVDLLKKKGLDAVVINEKIIVKNLAESDASVPNMAQRDFRPLRKKYSVDRLLLVEVNTLGFLRRYSNYIPVMDPQAYIKGAGFIVNLHSNMYEWYMPIEIQKSADKNWDEPPSFPGLSNAYFQVLELSKDAYTRPFVN